MLAVLTAKLIEGFGANEGLVRQDDEGGVYLRIERGEAGSQGARHSLLVCRVDHYLETLEQRGRKPAADGFRGSAENQDYLIYGRAAHVFDGLAQHCALTQAEQLFCFPHAGGFACGQNDGCHAASCRL